MITRKFPIPEKYLINKYLDELGGPLSKEYLSVLQDEYGIHENVFNKDRSIIFNGTFSNSDDDENSIPNKRIEIYAGLFGIKVEGLSNFTRIITPLKDR